MYVPPEHKKAPESVDALLKGQGRSRDGERATTFSGKHNAGESKTCALVGDAGLGSGGASGAAQAAPMHPSALPCQNSNNCPEFLPRKGYFLRKSGHALLRRGAAQVSVTESHEGVDSYGRVWERQDDGATFERTFGGVSPGEAKTAFALRRNIEGFTEHYERKSCAFLTTTPVENMSPRRMGEIFHDIRRHELEWIRSYVRVLEPQKRGAAHYHLVIATPWDLQPDAFNWEALKASADARKRGDFAEAKRQTKLYAQSATPELRECWSNLRDVCRRYGLGRSEMLPFRKESGAVAEYIGKYLESGLLFRQASWKGARRVEYDRGESREWKRASVNFGWVSSGAARWRHRVGELAKALGVTEDQGISSKLGPRWGYHMRVSMLTLQDAQWYDLLKYLAEEYGGKADAPIYSIHVGGMLVDRWGPGVESTPVRAEPVAARASSGEHNGDSPPTEPDP